MITIILIKKNGDLEEKNVKNINQDQIYKFCNYKIIMILNVSFF